MSRWIDADVLIARAFQDSERMYLESVVKHTPSIDICRCKECTERDDDWCMYWQNVINADDFCSYGERKESE